jgi:hypothetical protein
VQTSPHISEAAEELLQGSKLGGLVKGVPVYGIMHVPLLCSNVKIPHCNDLGTAIATAAAVQAHHPKGEAGDSRRHQREAVFHGQ